MKRVLSSLSMGIIMMLFFGGMLMAFTGKTVITLVKPETSYEDLMKEEPKEGMHVKGEVQYALDSYAHKETWKENDSGSRTPKETSRYYYVIPGNEDKYIGVEVTPDEKESMEALVEETYEYLSSGKEPSTKVVVEGRLTKMDAEMTKLFKNYFEDAGYSDKEIADMGEFYYVAQPNSLSLHLVMFGVGAFLILLAIVIFIIRFKKNGAASKAEKESEA